MGSVHATVIFTVCLMCMKLYTVSVQGASPRTARSLHHSSWLKRYCVWLCSAVWPPTRRAVLVNSVNVIATYAAAAADCHVQWASRVQI